MSSGGVQSQTIELFGATKVSYGDKMVRGITVSCGHCVAVESLPVNNFAGRNGAGDEREVQFIKRKMEGRGWKIGNKPDQHRCPGCFAAAKASSARRAGESKPNGEKPVSVTPIKSLKDIAPRLLGREDRRIIFAKLNEVYVGEKIGYGEGWTDEKVANDLGVPRAWVKLVRDENFGDEMASEEIRQKVEEASKLLEQVKAAIPFAEDVVANLKRLNNEAEHLGKSLDVIRKALGGG